MKTVEVTRHRNPGVAQSTWAIAADILRKEGIMGINKGVNAVALRQVFLVNVSSQTGEAGLELPGSLRRQSWKCGLLLREHRVLLCLSGSLRQWWAVHLHAGTSRSRYASLTQVIRVEMQSQVKDANRPAKMTIASTAKWIYEKNGYRGFYRVWTFNTRV
jgi:hypothetical protein